MSNKIIPGVSAGGINLGDSKDKVVQILGEPIGTEDKDSGYQIYQYPNIKVWFDDSDLVSQIGLYMGCEFKTDDGIGVGNLKEELIEKWGNDLAEHPDDYWFFISKGYGILFDFETTDKNEEIISKIFISSNTDQD